MLYQDVVLSYVTPQDYVININDPRNAKDFIDHLLPEDSVSTHGASHHAWAPGPNHLNPALPFTLIALQVEVYFDEAFVQQQHKIVFCETAHF